MPRHFLGHWSRTICLVTAARTGLVRTQLAHQLEEWSHLHAKASPQEMELAVYFKYAFGNFCRNLSYCRWYAGKK